MANNNPPKFEAIIYEVTGPVATITLNRPEMANAQNPQLIDEVDAAFDLADADDRVRVVVLAGKGPDRQQDRERWNDCETPNSTHFPLHMAPRP